MGLKRGMGWAVGACLLASAVHAKELTIESELPSKDSIENILVRAGWGVVPFGSSVVQQKGAEETVPAYAELNEAFSILRGSIQQLASSIALVIQAAHNLRADTGLELSQTCQMRAFLSRSAAIERAVGSTARWMPDAVELRQNANQVRSQLSVVRQLPNGPALFTESSWGEIKAAEDLVDIATAIYPTRLTPGVWTPIESCPVTIRMQPGEDLTFLFEERLEVVQSKPRKYLPMLNERYRLLKSQTVSVDIDGTHTTQVQTNLQLPLR